MSNNRGGFLLRRIKAQLKAHGDSSSISNPKPQTEGEGLQAKPPGVPSPVLVAKSAMPAPMRLVMSLIAARY